MDQKPAHGGIDQELFAKGLATYQKVVAANYMAHNEVYGLLRQVLLVVKI
jgi:hypothetical protein